MEKWQIRYVRVINYTRSRFKLTKLHVDEEIYNEARNKVQNLIRKKEKSLLWE